MCGLPSGRCGWWIDVLGNKAYQSHNTVAEHCSCHKPKSESEAKSQRTLQERVVEQELHLDSAKGLVHPAPIVNCAACIN